MLAMLAAFTLCLGARAAITTEGLVAYYPFDGDILESRGDRSRAGTDPACGGFSAAAPCAFAR